MILREGIPGRTISQDDNRISGSRFPLLSLKPVYSGREKPMEKKVLVLDIDGTLTNSKKEITNNTRQAIWDAAMRGHKVILASGRPTPGMRRYEEELKLDRYGGYLLSFNGARIVDCRTREVIYQRTLPQGLLPGLYQYARRCRMGLSVCLGDTAISAFEPDEYISLEAEINGLSIRVVEPFLEFVDFDIHKCLMTAPGEQAAIFERELQEQYGRMASIYRSEPYFVEIMPRDVTKASSLEKILPILGVDRENVICCGDGYNDISMIRYAGLGVAMANAQPAVKEAADYVTASNDEDGIVQVIREFMQ